jgi:hypothetical protein
MLIPICRAPVPVPIPKPTLSPAQKARLAGQSGSVTLQVAGAKAPISGLSSGAGGPRRHAGTGGGPWIAALRGGEESLALGLLARSLAGAAHGLGFFPRLAFGGLLVGLPLFHLSEDSFALHLLLEDAKSLIDIVVANEHLQRMSNLERPIPRSQEAIARRPLTDGWPESTAFIAGSP